MKGIEGCSSRKVTYLRSQLCLCQYTNSKGWKPLCHCAARKLTFLPLLRLDGMNPITKGQQLMATCCSKEAWEEGERGESFPLHQ